jgi:hypothetical protein
MVPCVFEFGNNSFGEGSIKGMIRFTSLNVLGLIMQWTNHSGRFGQGRYISAAQGYTIPIPIHPFLPAVEHVGM